MRSAAFLGVAILLLLVQSNLFRLIGPIGELIGPRWTHGVTPSLVLPLVVFLGVHEPSMARGALLAFGIGYSVDLFAGAPLGLFAFIYVAIWWLARVAGVRLTAQTAWTRLSLALVFALVESAMVLILLAVFGNDTKRPVEIASVMVPRALATAACSPLLFRLAQRLRQSGAPRPAAEGAA
jgi:rod shape-determining protein MreD